jgi:DNA-binding beta-propeller fold protein YncE
MTLRTLIGSTGVKNEKTSGNLRSLALRLVPIIGLILPVHAQAQIAVAGNDGEQPELGDVPKNPVPDTVSILDLNVYPPKIIGQVQVPFSMIGEPTSVAVSHNGRFALVTSSQKLDPADPTKFIPDDRLSVIDLANPAKPVVIQTLSSGAGATGISIDKQDRLALVANVREGTVAAFSIKGKVLTPAGKIQLETKPGPVDVAISPDNKTVLVTQRYGTGVWRLNLDGAKLTDPGIFIPTGVQSYGVQFSADGRYAYNTNLQGRPLPETAQKGKGPRIGTVTVIDLKTNTVVNTLDVGPTPEHLVLSPDGRFLSVTVVNGSSSKPGSRNFNPFGFVKVFRVEGPKLTQVAEARTGRWGQGATWSKDGRLILQQGAIERNIEVYRFDGKTLVRDAAATVKLPARPGAIATALSR